MYYLELWVVWVFFVVSCCFFPSLVLLRQTEINLQFKDMTYASPIVITVPSLLVTLLFDDVAQCHSIIQ